MDSTFIPCGELDLQPAAMIFVGLSLRLSQRPHARHSCKLYVNTMSVLTTYSKQYVSFMHTVQTDRQTYSYESLDEHDRALNSKWVKCSCKYCGQSLEHKQTSIDLRPASLMKTSNMFN